jgi:hypothetical protein
LNGALKALQGQHLLDILQALEKSGFEIAWHKDSD